MKFLCLWFSCFQVFLLLPWSTELSGGHLKNSWSFLSDSESYLKINGSTNIGNTLKLRFKSHDYNARLLGAKLGQHWLSLNLDGGIFSVIIDGKRMVVPKLSNVKVNDMEWHNVKLVLDKNGGLTLWLDRMAFYIPIARPKTSSFKLLWNDISFGKQMSDTGETNTIQNSFIGCLHLMHPYSTNPDHDLNNNVDKGRFVANGCLDACVIQSCANHGKCINRVNHAVCDCLGTGFDGSTCEQESPIIYMDGSSFITFDTTENPESYNQEFVGMRFRSTSQSGLLMKTSFEKDHIIIHINNGKVVVSLDFGGGIVKFESGKIVNDGKWHFIKFERHLRLLSFYLDGFLVGSSTLSSDVLQLRMSGGEELVYFGGSKQMSASLLLENKANFTGCLQQVRFNRVDIIHSVLYLKDWRLAFYGDRSRTCK